MAVQGAYRCHLSPRSLKCFTNSGIQSLIRPWRSGKQMLSFSFYAWRTLALTIKVLPKEYATLWASGGRRKEKPLWRFSTTAASSAAGRQVVGSDYICSSRLAQPLSPTGAAWRICKDAMQPRAFISPELRQAFKRVSSDPTQHQFLLRASYESDCLAAFSHLLLTA